MIERGLSAEQKITLATEIAATGIVIENLFLGRDPTADIITFVMVANVMGVPATPILQSIKETARKLLKRE